MLISHKNKFIFIHNYKVAGSSIQDALSKYNSSSFEDSDYIAKAKLLLNIYPKIYSNQFPGHITASELKSIIPEEVFNKYYKFGFVRNPWDWQVSLYQYMLMEQNHHQHKLIKSMKNFDEYIDWRINEDLSLQKNFFYENDTCIVDAIGRIENLESDFHKICGEIGVETQLHHLNASRAVGDDFLKRYSQKSIDLVYEAYNEDIQLFGYSKPIL